MNQDIATLIGVIALIILVFIVSRKSKEQLKDKSDQHSIFDDDEHLTIFMN